MRFSRRASFGIAAAAVLALGSAAHAQFNSIGVNFSGGAGDEPDPDQVTPVTGTTGVVPQANWNNAQGATGTLANLIDDTGAATGASLTFASNNTWGRDLSATPTNDLLSNYLDAGEANTATATVSNVPYAVYDVIVYARRNENPDLGNANRFSDYTVNGVSQTVLTGDVRDSFVASTPTTIGNFV